MVSVEVAVETRIADELNAGNRQGVRQFNQRINISVGNLLASLHMWDRWVGEVSVSIRRGRSSGRLRSFGLVIGTSLAGGTGCAKRFFDYRKDRRLRYSPLVSTEGACKPVRNGGIDALI